MYQWRDLKRHKCHFCLAFCSVFFIVLATLIVTSIISKGPVIFLKLSQDYSGEIDIFITPGTLSDLYPYYSRYFVNTTAVKQALTLNGTREDPYTYSPRKVFPSISWRNMDIFNPPSSEEEVLMHDEDGFGDTPKLKQGLYEWGNVILIDTEREREVNIGREYEYPALKEG
jgi:hypothetical protein